MVQIRGVFSRKVEFDEAISLTDAALKTFGGRERRESNRIWLTVASPNVSTRVSYAYHINP